MLRPEVVARASNYIGYANANRSATPLVDTVLTGNPAIYPDPDTMKRLQPTVVLPPKLERRRSRTWTKIKTGM
jgi:putrescine transport system substrate-binding protein